jgi:hypothetical protein
MSETTGSCFYCKQPDRVLTGMRCCSARCEQLAARAEQTSLDEFMDDRLAEAKFLRPINPDPVRTLAKELKRRI